MAHLNKAFFLLVGLSLTSISYSALAQYNPTPTPPAPTPSAAPTPTDTLIDEIKKLIAGYGTSDTALKALTAAPTDTLVVPEGLTQSLYAKTPTNPLATTQTQQAMANYYALNPDAKNSDEILANIINNTVTFGEANAPIPTAAGLYASCTASIITGGSAGLSNCLLEKQTPPFANVDLNSLVGPLIYKNGQEKTAANFINAAIGASYPLTPTDLNRIATRKKVAVNVLGKTDPDVAKYLVAIRSYATLQSVALSNLYQLYAERMPSKVDESTNKELFDALNAIKMPNASQLQVENYMATRRITDPQWVASLTKDTPAALLRQIVILMAENLAESYNNRLTSERLLATMSILDLSQAATIRSTVLDKVVQDIAKPPENEGGP